MVRGTIHAAGILKQAEDADMATSTKSSPAIAPMPTRVLFARIGWMTYYAGPQTGDEQPKGGGSYNRKNLGHEVFNFAEFGGRLYGFARAKSRRINLARIEPTAVEHERLDEVLVVFVASQRVIGWYRKAAVYAAMNQKLPPATKKEMHRRSKQSTTLKFDFWGHCFEAEFEDAVLLPLHERGNPKWRIPGNVKGGFGEYNLRYPFRSNGESNSFPWMKKAIHSVLSYNGSNLLIDRFPEVNTEEAAAIAQEKGQGFQSDPKIRRLVEEHAMKKAEKELKERGFGNFVNTSATKPYDLTCTKRGKKFFVEVKGTQTTGKSIILTKNEVKHVKANADSCILVVVHSVMVTNKNSATGGMAEITEKWDLEGGRLAATQYLWERQRKPTRISKNRTGSKTATAEDHQNFPMPKSREKIPLRRVFSGGEFALIQKGFIPSSMDDKWFIFFDSAASELRMHRSWTGYCIYILKLEEDGDGCKIAGAWANRDLEQYKSASTKHDVEVASWLIDVLLLGEERDFPSKS
jgi:hypothetical protein